MCGYQLSTNDSQHAFSAMKGGTLCHRNCQQELLTQWGQRKEICQERSLGEEREMVQSQLSKKEERLAFQGGETANVNTPRQMGARYSGRKECRPARLRETTPKRGVQDEATAEQVRLVKPRKPRP